MAGRPRGRAGASSARGHVTRRAALTGGAAALVSTAIAACGGSGNKPASSKAATSGTSASGIFKTSGSPKFVFVNHVTTNPFFVPTQYGAEDACKLLGCSYQWTGSENSQRQPDGQRDQHRRHRRRRRHRASALIDMKAFNAPVEAALKASIPVVAYNADETEQRAARLHRPGPVRVRRSRWASGSVDLRRLGRRRAVHRDAGLGRTSSRGSTARSRRSRRRRAITTHVVATGAAVPAELSMIDSYALGPSGARRACSRSTPAARRASRR